MHREMKTTGYYKNGREHLDDELQKLDASIQSQVLKHKALYPSDETEGFNGLYITEEEINKIMAKKSIVMETSSSSQYIRGLRSSISAKVENSLERQIYLPLVQLVMLFDLNPFEQDVLLVCLAPELDVRYEKIFAYLQDDVTKKAPSVNLILDLLCNTPKERTDARTCFFNQSPLLKFQLVQFSDDSQSRPLISRCLKLDDRIVNFLLEQDVMDSELVSFAKIIIPARDWSSVLMEHGLRERLSRLTEEFFNGKERTNLIFYLKGPYGAGKKLTAEAFCQQMNLPLLIVDINDRLAEESQPHPGKIVRRLFRETLLQPAVLYIEHFDRLFADNPRGVQIRNAIVRAVEEFSFITFLAGENSWHPLPGLQDHPVIKIELPIPSFQSRKQLWEISLNSGCPLSSDVNIDEIANTFRFTGGQIRDASAEARDIAMTRGSFDKYGITTGDLYRGCHAQSNQKLSKMARKVVPQYTWADIILPRDEFQQLEEICNYVRYRHMVYGEWGFGRKHSRGRGLNILFSGPTGTGKTMAAEIIANELKLDFYKIDLSCVVSKYIGETEKNLSAIFKEAETANAVLFFDEADALFGKRSEVKDAHDRYANIEINYLLQKMEEHEGIVILATNFRSNIDEAFTRRMHFYLDFPFPDQKYRLDIWQKIFPAETPRNTDIDYEFLAKRFAISGGSIKNIAVNSAFLAADNSKSIHMEHIIHAAKREYQKLGKICTQSEFGKYYNLIVSQPGGNQ
jgi:SpoVK/Ycf46/Vps4 family AAA+-type ATPase